jgi:hypothetical protein
MPAHHIASYLAAMNNASAGHQHDSGRYEIRLQGHLAARWTNWFDGMTLTTHSDGTTVLEGAVVDQAALHGLLTKLRDLGLPLLSVTHLDADQQAPMHTSSAHCDTTIQGD